MGRISFDNVSPDQLIAIGDGLLRAGNFSLAKGVYDVAIRRAPSVGFRQRARVRQGLAAAPNARTKMAFEIFAMLEAEGQTAPFVGEGLATWLKTLPFDGDARFQEIAERHAGLLPLPNWHWNLSTVLWAVQAADGVPGDYVELGVFKGHTTLFCAEYVEFQNWPKQWWLYDTFDGIPDDQLTNAHWASINDGLYRGKFSHEEVSARFAHFPNIKVIQGRVPEVLETSSPEQIAFMHIDLNNVPAEIGALDSLFERLSPGGIIVFDDYCWANSRDQHVAEKAWFAARGLHVLPMPTGQGVFTKR